jgi:phospholipid/cholesterol/gamma-HCH transport system substrate-binding protein
LTENLRYVAEALSEPQRMRQFVKIFDELTPLTQNLGAASREAESLLKGLNHRQRLILALDDLKAMTKEINVALPAFSKNAPELADDLSKISKNMAVLTEEMQRLMPLLGRAIPELPRAGGRALEALDETVVTLKALQKTFLLRGSVDEVKRQEAADEGLRSPAGQQEVSE